uniref:Arrestin C-terminal-like domain-containing protein n=1 Tax=Panagrolaimus sp. ES5 TaxID=591445 RepID=A0AC34FIA3_9BILA
MGYVCGELIPLHVSIENESTSEIKSVESGIGATYIFTATDDSLFNKHTMTKKIFKKYCVEDVPLPIGMTQNTVFTRDIEIPPIPPSFDHCAIIRLQYYVFVKVHTNAVFSRGASASMPIVIGTVPLRQTISTTNSVEPNFIGFEAYLRPPPPGIPPPDYDFNNANFREGDPEVKSEIKEDEIFKFQPKFPYFSDFSLKSNPRN